jgi:hypothetical protein
MFYLYKLLYAVTLDRRWLLKCIDIINRKTKEDVINYLNNKEV